MSFLFGIIHAKTSSDLPHLSYSATALNDDYFLPSYILKKRGKLFKLPLTDAL
jgi:hypothetical protein